MITRNFKLEKVHKGVNFNFQMIKHQNEGKNG